MAVYVDQEQETRGFLGGYLVTVRAEMLVYTMCASRKSYMEVFIGQTLTNQ